MKITTLLTAALLAASIQLATPLYGQPNDSMKGPRHREGRWANLSPQEQEKMKAARHTAMRDPSVQAAKQKLRQARDEFRNTMQAAMLKADPSIQPILQKMPADKHGDRDDD